MYTIGIDLGGTNIAIGLCDSTLKIIDKDSTPTLAERTPEAILSDMATLTKKIIKRNNLTLDDIEYIGMAVPGVADTSTGHVGATFNIPFANYDIGPELSKLLSGKKVIIANDANAAALGEFLAGSAKEANSSVMITLGTGVGGGVILDGKIFAGGFTYAGAELGHMVISVGGRQCSCGRRGCWEAYSSATALREITEEKMNELKIKGIKSALFDIAAKDGKVTAKTAFDAMRAGDKYGQQIVDYYIEHLAAGITNIINMFQPEILCIGGGVCNEKDYLLIPLNEIVDREQYTRDEKKKTKIVIATLKNDAGIIGAAGLGK